MGAGDLCLQLIADGIKAIHICRGKMILDFNGLASVDQLLKPDLVSFGEIAILALFQERFDLCIQRIQRLDVSGELIGNAGITGILRIGAHLLQFRPGSTCERLEGIRPSADNFVRFFLAIRPDGQQPIHPILRGLHIAGEVGFRHAEEGQTISTIEGFGCGVLPVFSGLSHTLQRFTRLLRAGYIIPNGNGGGDSCGSDGYPHSRGLAQHGHEPLKAAARFSHSGGELADACGDYADALCDLGEAQHDRAGGSSDGSELDDLHALCFIHRHELVKQLVRAIDQVVDGGIEVITEGLPEKDSLVLQVGQSAGSGGIALARFCGERGIFFPRFIGGDLRFSEQLIGVDGAE